jgi:hypothetical protein
MPLAVAVTLAAAFGGQARAAGPNGGAAGGVIAIDQAKAEAGGVTSGDAPGFPVTLSQPGSYRLMSNLTVTSPNVHAIEVTSNDVTLDLNGFVIQGPVTCMGGSPATITCSPASNAAGVFAWNKHLVNVRNGTIRGFGVGVYGSYFGRLEDLRIAHVTEMGLNAGNATQVNNNIVYMSAGYGILGYGDFRNNAVYFTKLDGIRAGFGSLVIGNRVSQVGQYGIYAEGFGNAALALNSVTSATQGAIFAGVKIDGNACNGQLCQ